MNQHMPPEPVPFIDIGAQRRRLGKSIDEAIGRVLTHCQFVNGPEVIALEGEGSIRLRALFTPGHARGHLCFYDEAKGVLISGDNVVGFGSVLIDPQDGNMIDYLDSLRRMRALPNLTVLLPGHGPAVARPYEKIDQYAAHRLEREAKILEALRDGASTTKEIVTQVYTDVSPKALAMAERSVLAHLEKLIDDRLVRRAAEGEYEPCQDSER